MTWRERVVAARERGHFTDADRRDAGQWSTCAVGEQKAMHPTVVIYEVLAPSDKLLYHMGGELGFYMAVLDNEIDKAEKYLDQIEDRVLALKRAL